MHDFPYDVQVLDQLASGDLPLRVLVSMGPDFGSAMRTLRRHYGLGTIRVLDPEGRAVDAPAWDALCYDAIESLDVMRGYRASITPLGLDLRPA